MIQRSEGLWVAIDNHFAIRHGFFARACWHRMERAPADLLFAVLHAPNVHIEYVHTYSRHECRCPFQTCSF